MEKLSFLRTTELGLIRKAVYLKAASSFVRGSSSCCATWLCDQAGCWCMWLVLWGWLLDVLFVQAMQIGPTIMTLLAFITAANVSDDFTAARVFVALTYFNLLRQPMMQLPRTFNNIAEAYVSMERVRTFLCAGEIDSEPERVAELAVAVSIQNATFRV